MWYELTKLVERQSSQRFHTSFQTAKEQTVRFWLLTEISLLSKVSLVGLYSKTVSDTQSRGVLQGIKMQEVYGNGICWFTAWTNFSKEWQEAHAFPHREG